MEGDFEILTVDEGNIRMSDFITRKLELTSFMNGNAFYEFNQPEDLLYFKEVVILKATNQGNTPKVINCHVKTSVIAVDCI